MISLRILCSILKNEKSQNGGKSSYTPTWYQYEDEDYMDLLKKDIKFNPMPGMTVSGPCTWETKVTRMENRIPRRISEVFCREGGAPCGDSPTFKVSQSYLSFGISKIRTWIIGFSNIFMTFVLQFQCQQLTTQMDVAYTMNLNDTSSQGQVGSEVVVHKRNVMVAIGCGCVQSRPRRLQQFMQMMVEKKKRNQESGRSIGDGERISSNSN